MQYFKFWLSRPEVFKQRSFSGYISILCLHTERRLYYLVLRAERFKNITIFTFNIIEFVVESSTVNDLLGTCTGKTVALCSVSCNNWIAK